MQVGILFDENLLKQTCEFVLIDNKLSPTNVSDLSDLKEVQDVNNETKSKKRKFDCVDTFKLQNDSINNESELKLQSESLPNGQKLLLLPWIFASEKRLKIEQDN